jgi:hypothetical protein
MVATSNWTTDSLPEKALSGIEMGSADALELHVSRTTMQRPAWKDRRRRNMASSILLRFDFPVARGGLQTLFRGTPRLWQLPKETPPRLAVAAAGAAASVTMPGNCFIHH